MATIPMGNFGQQVAGGSPNVNFQTGAPGGQAIAQTGAILQQAGVTLGNEQVQKVEQQRRATAALALAKTQNEMHDAHDEIGRAVLDGSMPADKAPGELQQRLGKIRQNTLGQLLPEQQSAVDAHLEGTAGTLQRNLVGVIEKRQQKDLAGTIDQFGEQVQREGTRQGPGWASEKYGAMVDFIGPQAGLDDKQRASLKQKFTEGVHYDFFRNAAQGALEQGNVGELKNLREQITGPGGDAIDPVKRSQLRLQVFGWEQSLLARQDRASAQAEEATRVAFNQAVDVFNKGVDIATAGGYLAPDFIERMTVAAAGTEMEKPVANLIASQREIAGFASRPATERQATIERMRAARATPGQGVDPAGEKLLGALTTMDEKLRTQAKENPWAAAQAAGVIQEAPVFSLADPQAAIATVQQRMQVINKIENWTGQKASPLQPAEIDQLGKFVRQLPLDQAATMLGNIGQAVGDAERVAALGKQLHDKDGTLGEAMMYATFGTTQGRRTAELVLRGDQAMQDKTAMIDKAQETGWRGKIAKEIRGLYSNREAEDVAIDAAFKITAARYAEGSGADLDAAIKLATGGIAVRNGQKFPLPYGMSEDDFDKRLANTSVHQLAAQAPDGRLFAGKVPLALGTLVESLPKATLVDAGQGRYWVRSGTALVSNAKGQPITVQVSQ